MFKVTLRFMGRFVYAEKHKAAKPAGALDVLAVNMLYNPEVRAGRHQFALSVARTAVLQPGSLPPDLMVASQEEADLAEYGVWLLPDHDVTFEGAGTFAWSQRTNPLLVDLSQLAPGAALDQAALVARGSVAARVHIPAGTGESKQAVLGRSADFVALSDQNPQTPRIPAAPLADLVTVELSTDNDFMPVLVRSRAGGPLAAIMLKSAEEPTLTFTNLCPLPHGNVDEEFAALYEVLQNPPLSFNRLVPRETATLGHLDDCYKGAYIAYEA